MKVYLGGIALSYVESGEGAPLLMLHGITSSAAFFQEQIDFFSDRYRVIALDFRGHGRSDVPKDGYTIEQFAKDVKDVLDVLKISCPVVLCHSLGCAVVWEFLSLFGNDHPLGKLIMVDQSPCILRQPWFTDAEAKQAGSTMSELVQIQGMVEWFQSQTTIDQARAVVKGWAPNACNDRIELLAKDFLTMPRDGRLLSLFWDNAVHDWRARIQSIKNKTLVVGGEHSFVPKESQQWIANCIPRATLKVYPANHFVFTGCAVDFNKDVLDFINNGETNNGPSVFSERGRFRVCCFVFHRLQHFNSHLAFSLPRLRDTQGCCRLLCCGLRANALYRV